MLAVSDSVWETETDRSDTKSFEQKPDPVSLLFCFNLRLVEIRGLLWRNLKFPIFLFHKSKEKKFILALTIILPFKATRFASLSKSFASQIYFNMSCCFFCKREGHQVFNLYPTLSRSYPVCLTANALNKYIAFVSSGENLHVHYTMLPTDTYEMATVVKLVT